MRGRILTGLIFSAWPTYVGPYKYNMSIKTGNSEVWYVFAIGLIVILKEYSNY